MKRILCLALMSALVLGGGQAQTAEKNAQISSPAASPDARSRPAAESDDLQQLRADVQRMKVLLNQMRTNLAFVQTSQTPLKHQFELEVDAWQVVVEQLERRVKRMEERKDSGDGKR